MPVVERGGGGVNDFELDVLFGHQRKGRGELKETNGGGEEGEDEAEELISTKMVVDDAVLKRSPFVLLVFPVDCSAKKEKKKQREKGGAEKMVALRKRRLRRAKVVVVNSGTGSWWSLCRRTNDIRTRLRSVV